MRRGLRRSSGRACPAGAGQRRPPGPPGRHRRLLVTGQGDGWSAGQPARRRPAHAACRRGARPGRPGPSPPPARPPRPAHGAAGAGTAAEEAGSASRAAPTSPASPPLHQPQEATSSGAAAAGVDGHLVAGMLGLGQGRGHPPAASPPTAPASSLVGVTTAAKIQDQVRDLDAGSSDAATEHRGGQANLGGGLPAHAALPLGPEPPRVRRRCWRARSTARSSSTAAGSWRRRVRASRAAARWQDRQKDDSRPLRRR
jgi:hypothetical protein